LQASGGFRIVTVPLILVKARRRSVNSRYLVDFSTKSKRHTS
jgi:hypothetical protein